MRTASLFACLLLLLSAGALAPAAGHAAPQPVSTQAEGAALIDVSSGRILYSHQGDKRMRIASLTKIMTAIVAIEHGKLSERVKVNKNAYGKEGSSIYLKLGEEMSLHHMLYGLMLRSGNDAATAIAEHVGGSLEGFVYLMNEKAQQLGLENTHFMNPHGLDEEGHYSTANDLAKLTAYALKNPVFREIVKTKVKTVPNPNEPWDYKWYNKNKMLSLYEGADGVKTGYTKLANRCLVSSATRNGQQLAAVTLNDRTDWADHSRLLDYGFMYYPLTDVVVKGERVDGYNLAAGASFRYPLAEEERLQISKRVKAVDRKSIDYRFGERARMDIYLGENRISTIPLYESAPTVPNETEKTALLRMLQTGVSFPASYRHILSRVIQGLFTLR